MSEQAHIGMFEERLAVMGNDGWELVAALPPSAGHDTRFFLKRPKHD